MPGFSTYEANKVLNHQLRSATNAKRANNYIGLCTADPTDAGVLTSEAAIGVNGYARVAVAMSDANWTAPAVNGGVSVVANAVNITYGDPTGDWAGGAQFTHFIVMDAPTGGNMIISGPIGTPRPVLATDNAPTFGPGALTVQLA